jgi:hypothetical protein
LSNCLPNFIYIDFCMKWSYIIRLFGKWWGNDSCIGWIPAFAGMTTTAFVSFPCKRESIINTSFPVNYQRTYNNTISVEYSYIVGK